LLSKDGINLCIDSFRDAKVLACQVDISLEDNLGEEDVTEDLWHFASSGLENLPEFSVVSVIKTVYISSEVALLNVLLDQVSPPPRIV
jgi:ligand-binding sensor protein